LSSKIGLVLKGYPRLSETFIAQEILQLERLGFEIEIISLRHPYDDATHPVHAEISATVHYLPEYLRDEPRRVFNAWRKARKLPGYRKAFWHFVKDFRRDRTRNRIRRFGQAMVMATEFSSDIKLYYAHFLHTPTSVARYASFMTSVPYSISAHAKDIWTSPDWEIREKLNDCEWCVTCTRGGQEHLASLAPDDDRVKLVYHGLDLSRFPSPRHPQSSRDGNDRDDPVRLISVGRAVAKKGFDTLLDALAKLPADLHWQWTHIGGGELHGDLVEQAANLGLQDQCRFLGGKPQSEVIEQYKKSDIFILPCRIVESGDRDGLPNVIVEAQSQRLPVITTAISGIPELIEHDKNGIFVDPDDAEDRKSVV